MLKKLKRLIIKFTVGAEVFLVNVLHCLCQNIYKHRNAQPAHELSKELGLNYFALYSVDSERNRFIYDNKKLLQCMFANAKRISEKPPINQYVLRDKELEILCGLITNRIKLDLLDAYGTNFVCIYAYLIEYLPYTGSLDSSHIWHTDGYPMNANHHKLICYLTDCDQKNGSFEYQSIDSTRALIKKGFKGSYPERHFQNEAVNKLLAINENINVVKGASGTAFVFNPSALVHRAGSELKEKRQAIVFELMPYKDASKLYIDGGQENLLSINKLRYAVKHWFF